MTQLNYETEYKALRKQYVKVLDKYRDLYNAMFSLPNEFNSDTISKRELEHVINQRLQGNNHEHKS